ncbi:D-3-phosphoglycerate dehydrogenase [Noviherbaspirillum humi]|uniref:D-3-phosphoglycerate dehydrogenase n=1 Tax=Noviherbaspirillum humi TaxID=1688639 RepID=A0A239C0J2_9BURK|nr:D-3-phosphoglycerate dehydrogenase [Noviherbaspirillum humi]
MPCFELLAGHEVKIFTNTARGVGQLAVRLAPFEALVLNRDRTSLPRLLLAKLPNLRLIAQAGRVGPHIDVDAATRQGIAVADGVSDPTATAELTWTLIMAAMRRLSDYAGLLKEGLWQAASITPARNGLGRSLKGRTLGIWGYGRIGSLVAGYGRAFGMQVVIWGSDASRQRAQADGHAAAASREAFFAGCDVVSLHLRLDDATLGIVGADDLARMSPQSLLVNTSCAELIAPGALLEALQRGRPGQAALDVFENEPLAPTDPLLRLPNLLATPHIGHVEQDSYEQVYRAAFENVLNFARGEPTNLINPEILK